MPPLLYPLPTTALLTFSNVFTDPSSSHTTALADATAARTRLQLSLRAFANQEQGYSALAVVDAVQGYLPYLRGIIACLDADDLLFKADPSFPWKSSLTHYTSSAPLVPLAGIHAEHLFVLLTYTLALSNYAHAVLEALPTISVSMTSEDEKRMAAGLARGVDLLCQAAGIAEWTAENICPLVDHVRTVTSRLGRHKWPVEVSGETFRGLSMTLLADAHLTAIRKLVLPVLPHILFAPAGPPLPSKHPSPSLLSKLYLHVATCYASARALLKVSQEAPRRLLKDEPEPVEGEIIAPVKRYLRKESNLATALGYKWLGIDAGENGKGEKVGEALAWTKEAQSRLGDMEDSKMREKMKGLGIGRNNDRKKEERKARKGRVDREVEDIAAWVKAYSRMNDTVAFQPIPSISTLAVPAGRPIFGVKPFKPPASKFGPAVHEEEGEKVEKVDEYAGKGNYF